MHSGVFNASSLHFFFVFTFRGLLVMIMNQGD